MALVPTSSILSNVYSPSSVKGLTLWYDMFTPEYVVYNSTQMIRMLDKSGRGSNSGLNNGIIRYLSSSLRNGGGCIWITAATGNWVNIPQVTREDWSWFVLINGVPSVNATSSIWSAGRGILDANATTTGAKPYGMSLVSTALACGLGSIGPTGPTVTDTLSTIFISSVTNGLNAVVPYGNDSFYICEYLRHNNSGHMESWLNGGNMVSTIGETGIRSLTFNSAFSLATTRLNSGSNLINARFYEILLYSTFLSSIDREQIEGYLAWKWGFANQLPLEHPYRNNPYIVTPEATPRTIPNNTFILPVDTFSTIKTFTFPDVTQNPGRMIIIKDYVGSANRNPIYISTQGTDLFQDLYSIPTDYGVLSTPYGAWTFQNDGSSKWMIASEYVNTLESYAINPTIYPSGPMIYLDPPISTFFPDFTSLNISTFPVNMGDYLNFSGTGNQFLSCRDAQQFNMSTNGFAVKFKIMWTQMRNNARVFEFNSGANVNDVYINMGSTSNSLNFFYRTGATNAFFGYGNSFSTNFIYNITVNYLPFVSRFGTYALWVNGILVLSNDAGVTPADKTPTNTFIGRSSDGGIPYLAARLYKFAVYDRWLTNPECAYLW